jgi:CHAT domain-containing protein/tetratricopeptide (TPR) repeat protein
LRRNVILAVVWLALVMPLHARISPDTSGNSQAESALLELGKPIEREMRGGETHSYRIHAAPGQFVRVVVLQEGIDVSVMLLDSEGKQFLIVDSMNGSYGPESASIIAEESGDMQLNVSTTSADASAGHYQIELTDLRAPTDVDRTRIKAERTYAEGYSLFDQKNVESERAAAAKWRESFVLWQSLDDQYGEALSVYSEGAALESAHDAKLALQSFNQSLALWRALGDREREGRTLSNIASIYYSYMGDKAKAIEYCDQAIPLFHASGDFTSEARTLLRVGVVHFALGENQRALDDFQQALSLYRTVDDPKSKAATLSNIGSAYFALGENQNALNYLNQALPLRRAAADRAGEGQTLFAIGLVYQALGKDNESLSYYEQALLLTREVSDRGSESAVLNKIGLIRENLGDYQTALDYYNLSRSIKRSIGEHQGEATMLNTIAEVYERIGEMEKALDCFDQSLTLHRELQDRGGEAFTLTRSGWLRFELGEIQNALDSFNQALSLARAIKDRVLEATALNDIGGVYYKLGEYQESLDYYKQALSLYRAERDRVGEATSLSNIGLSYKSIGDNQNALDYYDQSLALALATQNRATEAITLQNLGSLYYTLGQKQKALDFLSRSLPLSRATQNPVDEASVLVLIMEYWTNQRDTNLAILFGKQAIDRLQRVRRNIGGLEKEAQRNFLKSKEQDYRELAELLISTGRLPEAQQILDLLKAEEYSEFTQRRGGPPGPETDPVALTPVEEKSNTEYQQLTSEITVIGDEWTRLYAKSSRSADEEKRYNDLSDRLTAANQRFRLFLETLYDTFGKGDQANARLSTINDQTAGLQTLVGELGVGTTAVYTLVLDQKCVLMVITPATRVAREVMISKIVLRGKVFAFVQALSGHKPEEGIQAKAQELYNILIAPIEKDLQGAQTKTLVWSLDDVLRYVPLAALYDGKQYLVERYRNVMITTASIGNLKDQPQVASWRGVAMGVSKDYDGLGKLTAVPDELDSVVRSDKTPGSHGPIPGTILLDDSFTETGMETALRQHPALVHIASHYVFHVGDDTKSYLLLSGKDAGGQGFHLTLADLRDDPRMDFQGVELLTLAGCQTAEGSNDSDGREIDGLGITAQRKGAKAVMATLWAVDDESVGLLMATFYKLWVTTPGITKAEALQQAQLALLRGTADLIEGPQDPSATKSSAGASKQRPASQYANPYYWAPFILIGNWK